MKQRVATAGVLSIISAMLLTGCTPPMPPEVQAALAEQVYTCQSGAVTTDFPAIMSDATSAIADSVSSNCPDMTFSPATDDLPADLIISETNPNCAAYNQVPFALDAGVVVGLLPDASGLILSPDTVQAIFQGTITNWDDPQITKDNGDIQVGSGAIQIFPKTDSNSLEAFGSWYQHLTGKKFVSKLQPVDHLTAADLADLADNSIALMPFSVFTDFSVTAMTIPYSAAILLDSKANPAGVASDIAGIASAGTQLVAKRTEAGVTVKINYSNKPIAPEGSDIAPEPYGAVFTANLTQCGTDSKVKRAVSRFLLRQDSQGALTTFVALPEAVRAEALVSVSQGLKVKLPKVPQQ